MSHVDARRGWATCQLGAAAVPQNTDRIHGPDPRQERPHRACPDTCRRGGESSLVNGRWITCMSCGGVRYDLAELEDRWIANHAVENAWLEHYGYPTLGRAEARRAISRAHSDYRSYLRHVNRIESAP